MSYLKNYKRRVGLGTSSHKEFTRNEIERNFIEYLHTSPTCHMIPMTDPDEIEITDKTKRVLCSINDLSINDKKAYDEKKILVSNDTNVDVGCYFFWDNCYWIIIFKEHKSLGTYKKFIARRCNQILKYRLYGVTYEIPINIENLTMYSDGLADLKYTSQQDSKRTFTFGSNPVTRTLVANRRIMLTGKTVFRVTHINDFEYNGAYTGAEGIIKILVLQTTLRDEDDLVNNIAWNENSEKPIETPELSIIGDSRAMTGSKKIYTAKNMDSTVSWRVNAKDDVAICTVNEDSSLTIQFSSNVNHTGEKITIQLVSLDTGDVVDSMEVQLRGFM